MGYDSHYTDWAADWAVWGLNASRGKKFFSSLKCPDLFWGPLSLLFGGYWTALFPGVKQLGQEADHSQPSSGEVKNE